MIVSVKCKIHLAYVTPEDIHVVPLALLGV